MVFTLPKAIMGIVYECNMISREEVDRNKKNLMIEITNTFHSRNCPVCRVNAIKKKITLNLLVNGQMNTYDYDFNGQLNMLTILMEMK